MHIVYDLVQSPRDSTLFGLFIEKGFRVMENLPSGAIYNIECYYTAYSEKWKLSIAYDYGLYGRRPCYMDFIDYFIHGSKNDLDVNSVSVAVGAETVLKLSKAKLDFEKGFLVCSTFSSRINLPIGDLLSLLPKGNELCHGVGDSIKLLYEMEDE